jgi:hypothetical protein
MPAKCSLHYVDNTRINTYPWQATGSNKKGKTYTCFYEPMAQVIQHIPVSKHGGDDYAVWEHTKLEQYAVRSAYRLARTERFCLNEELGVVIAPIWRVRRSGNLIGPSLA